MQYKIETPGGNADLEKRLLQAIESCQAATLREEATAKRFEQAIRRTKAICGAALTLLTVTVTLLTLKPVGAQGGYGPTLASLQAQVNTVLNRTQFMCADATSKTTKFTGCNVYIQSGSGHTSDNYTPTGLGNLTVGYNEERGTGNVRTGSHNLILGDANNYSSFGGIVCGSNNTVSGYYASVTGGDYNTASGIVSSISGGGYNTASYDWCSISGGNGNSASASFATICGGYYNIATNNWATILGGNGNVASGTYASVLGGENNNAAGTGSTISGGGFCYARGYYLNGVYNSILGGYGISNSTQFGHSP